MAAVLDVNILCRKLIDFNTIQSIMERYEVTVKSVSSIDDWMWSNEQYIEPLNKIAATVECNKITIIQLEKSSIKDLGIYVEKVDDFYLYTLWINTEGYPQLDCDVITPENQSCYNKIWEEIIKIEDQNPNTIKIMGSGIETDFFYSRNVDEIIWKSSNMIIWLVSGSDTLEKMLSVELTNNDVYFMEVLEDIVVINDNYCGILVFNNNLEQICTVKLFEGLSIYSSFKHGRKILLFCPENNCLVYADLDSNEKKIIPLKEFEDWIFSTLCIWRQNNVILSDYKGHFVNVDLKRGELYINDIKDMGLIDYVQEVKVIHEFEEEQYHDYDWNDDYIAKIGEDKVEMIHGNSRTVFSPAEGYYFLKGRIMEVKGDKYLFLLSGLKSDIENSKIEKIKFK